MVSLALAFLRTDFRRVRRDSFLLGMVAMSLGMAVVVRFALPAIGEAVVSVDLQPYYPLFVGYFVICVSELMMGTVGGFLLLESREEEVVRALAVTPASLSSYLWALGAALAICAAVLAVLEAIVIQVGLPPWRVMFLCALGGALFAPAIAFFLAGFASNKVEAFAVTKILGLTALLPIGAWFLPEPWQWLTAIYPPYSVCKAWWVALAGGDGWPMWLVASVVVSAAYLGWFGRRFSRAACR